MNVVYVGGTSDMFRDSVMRFLTQHNKRYTLMITNPTLDQIKMALFGQGLFDEEETYVFRDIDAEVFENGIEGAKGATGKNTVIFHVEKILKKQKECLVGAGWHVYELDQVTKRQPPSFVLADAFLKRDKKASFVALHQELRVKPAEEVHGGIWYQIKNMYLISTSPQEHIDLHPFVYKKLSTALQLFTKEEVEHMLQECVYIYHESHQGTLDLPVALEQFVLKWTK